MVLQRRSSPTVASFTDLLRAYSLLRPPLPFVVMYRSERLVPVVHVNTLFAAKALATGIYGNTRIVMDSDGRTLPYGVPVIMSLDNARVSRAVLFLRTFYSVVVPVPNKYASHTLTKNVARNLQPVLKAIAASLTFTSAISSLASDAAKRVPQKNAPLISLYLKKDVEGLLTWGGNEIINDDAAQELEDFLSSLTGRNVRVYYTIYNRATAIKIVSGSSSATVVRDQKENSLRVMTSKGTYEVPTSYDPPQMASAIVGVSSMVAARQTRFINRIIATKFFGYGAVAVELRKLKEPHSKSLEEILGAGYRVWAVDPRDRVVIFRGDPTNVSEVLVNLSNRESFIFTSVSGAVRDIMRKNVIDENDLRSLCRHTEDVLLSDNTETLQLFNLGLILGFCE